MSPCGTGEPDAGQVNVNGPVPPTTVANATPVAFPKQVTSIVSTSNKIGSGSVKTIGCVNVQPSASVITTECGLLAASKPPCELLIVEGCPFQEYEYGAPAPPEGLTVAVVLPPLQRIGGTERLGIIAVG